MDIRTQATIDSDDLVVHVDFEPEEIDEWGNDEDGLEGFVLEHARDRVPAGYVLDLDRISAAQFTITASKGA